jgi:hypothetical protein
MTGISGNRGMCALEINGLRNDFLLWEQEVVSSNLAAPIFIIILFG